MVDGVVGVEPAPLVLVTVIPLYDTSWRKSCCPLGHVKTNTLLSEAISYEKIIYLGLKKKRVEDD